MTLARHGSEQRSVREDLTWFHINLNNHIEDRELEKSGVKLEFFWDNSQVQRAVLGALDLFNPGFNEQKFENKETLVACLAAQGWLGAMRMLEPHQAEFARALRRKFSRDEAWLTAQQRKAFLDAARLPDGDNRLSRLGELGSKERKKVIARYAGYADRLFKALQAGRGPWRDRLSSMYLSKVLELSEARSAEDYELVFGSEDFRKLRDELNLQRPFTTDNNVADAACLCLLQRQLQAYQEGRERILPRFYQTSRTFRLALERTELLEKFSYRDAYGNKTTVLRDSDYFLFRAALTVKDERADSSLANLDLEELRELSERIRYALDPNEPLQLETLDEILVGKQSIQTIINDLSQLWILERIWLPFYANEDLDKLDAEERDRLEGLPRNEQVTRTVDATVQKVQSALQANVGAYVSYRDLYRRLDQYVVNARRHYETSALASERLYFVSGLVRFGIPDTYTEEIETLLNALLRGEGDQSREEACAELVKMCLVARRPRTVREKTLAFGLLWALDYLDAILEFPVELQEERWVLAMYASAALHRKTIPAARHWIKVLEARMPADGSDTETEALATALAYLYFHLWREEGGRVRWRFDRTSSTARTASELQELVDMCLQYANIAYKAQPRETPSWLYVLNIRLFYLTEAATDEQFRQASSLATELISYGGETRMWQYRFDDTLARYFHRRALLVSNPHARQTAWQSHRTYLKRAVDHNPGNPEVTMYQAIVNNSDFGVEVGHE